MKQQPVADLLEGSCHFLSQSTSAASHSMGPTGYSQLRRIHPPPYQLPWQGPTGSSNLFWHLAEADEVVEKQGMSFQESGEL